MKQVIVELDDETAARLDAVAPSRSRKRSEFVRTAIRRALWLLDEKQTEAAYLEHPDDEPAFFDADAWEARERPSRKGVPKRRR